MELEVRHLRLVQAVATLGSLTAAAGQLNLTQSALSHQLRDIEERLGTPLFLRRSRRMIATAAGQRLLATAARVLADLARTEAQVRDIAGCLAFSASFSRRRPASRSGLKWTQRPGRCLRYWAARSTWRS